MVSCPYTGAVVSRPEDCPEFSNSGGNGGCSGCGTGDGPANDGPELERADMVTETVTDCIRSTALARGSRDIVGKDLDDAKITFFYNQAANIPNRYAQTIRLMDHPDSRVSRGKEPNEFGILINWGRIRNAAEVRGVTEKHFLSDVLVHEYTHVRRYLQGESQPALRDHVHGDSVWIEGWENFQNTFGTVAPTHRTYSHQFHGPAWSSFPDCLR